MRVDVVEYFSPMYWMVPQMVKALPPLSRRRDKPKSAKRRCPRTDHFLYITMRTWYESPYSDSTYWCSYNRRQIFKCSHHNLISLARCSLQQMMILFALMCIDWSGCSLEGSVLLLHTRAMLLSAGDKFLLTVVCQQDILHLQKSDKKTKLDTHPYYLPIKKMIS